MCTTPSRRAKALFGRWEEGTTTKLVFTEHGLFALYRRGERTSAGLFGVPRSNQILVSQVMGFYPLRSLWKIEKFDEKQMVIVFPDGQQHSFTKAQPAVPGDSQLTGLWESPAGFRNWNMLEFTRDGDFIEIRRMGRRRADYRQVATMGRFRTDKNKVIFTRDSGNAHTTEYASTLSDLRLKRATNREAVFTKIQSPRHLEKGPLRAP